MYLTMVGLWGLCCLYFGPRLFALLIGPEPVFVKIILFVFIALQIVFWFYCFFHLVVVSFSYFNKRIIKANHNYPALEPAVALLYTTCNDFRAEAAVTHLNQEYNQFHLFILDDSSDQFFKSQIDEFALKHKPQVSVIRREGRSGFKAGNVNHGLRQIPKEYEFFSVSDADTLLAPSYIRDLLPYVLNESTAFVQAHLKSYPQQTTDFARNFSLNTDIHFERYTKTKNIFGFVMWYGHGALLRRDIYNELGGFPEIATEDLAYSLTARLKGYHGIYCEKVICLEEFPPTYIQYRRRNEKWIRGTLECLLKFYPDFLKSPQVAWFEKIDVLASAGTLLLAFPYMLFLVLGSMILPLFYNHFQFAGPMLKMPIAFEHVSLGMMAQVQSNLFWSWDLFVLLIATILAPALPVVIDYWRKPKLIINYLNVYVFCFFSVQIVSAIHILVTILSRTAVFPVTGAKDQPEEFFDKNKPWYLRSHANMDFIFVVEFGVGILLGIWSLRTQNIWLVPIAVGLVLSPCLVLWNLNNRVMRQLIAFPTVAILVVIYFIVHGLLRI